MQTPTSTQYLRRLDEYQTAFNTRRRRLVALVDAATISGRVLQQPRDGRGRLLGRKWLAAAEAYSVADHAWFRSPVAV